MWIYFNEIKTKAAKNQFDTKHKLRTRTTNHVLLKWWRGGCPWVPEICESNLSKCMGSSDFFALHAQTRGSVDKLLHFCQIWMIWTTFVRIIPSLWYKADPHLLPSLIRRLVPSFGSWSSGGPQSSAAPCSKRGASAWGCWRASSAWRSCLEEPGGADCAGACWPTLYFCLSPSRGSCE